MSWLSSLLPHIIVLALPLPERKLIARIRKLAGAESSRSSRNSAIIAGIGDDCSVLRIPPGHDTLITTDFSLEGVHFRRDWHPAAAVGHRCLARGLSDVAAMGGEPVAAFLSLALPENLPQAWVDDFFRGFVKPARKFHVELAGGDTAQSPSGILADIVVVGSVPKGAAILRSGARPGDFVYVTGALGASAATLKLLESRSARKPVPGWFAANFYPMPRVAVGKVLRARQIATAMIDVSDGLSTDLNHLCEESGVGAAIWQRSVPRARIRRPPMQVDVDLALHGGEDYELLFTARPGTHVPATIAGVPVTRIGEITRRRLFIASADGTRGKLEPRGWEHFRQSSRTR